MTHSSPLAIAMPRGRNPTGCSVLPTWGVAAAADALTGGPRPPLPPPPATTMTAATTSSAASDAQITAQRRRLRPRAYFVAAVCSPLSRPGSGLARPGAAGPRATVRSGPGAPPPQPRARRAQGRLPRKIGRRAPCASARWTTSSNPDGRSGRSVDTRGGFAEMCANSFAWTLSRSNGTAPVSIRCSTQPRAYTSARASTVPPRICSGAAKSGVPTSWSPFVRSAVVSACLARPKSER